MMLGPIGFGAPLMLAGLAVLPVLWWILRALPPMPRRVRFPGTVLLAGLHDPDPVARRTPRWLLLLRLSALAAVIVASAGPVWRPAPPATEGDALLIVMDSGGDAGANWAEARIRALRAAEIASAAGQPVAVLLADGQGDEPLNFGPGKEAADALRAASPQPWPGAYPVDPAAALANVPAGRLRTLWLSDGLDHPGRADWLAVLADRGPVAVLAPSEPAQSLRMIESGAKPVLELAIAGTGPAPKIVALGPDPQGILRELARLDPGAPVRQGGIVRRPVAVDLPPELLGRVTRFRIDGSASATAVVLGDDRLRRPLVALVSDGRAGSEGQELLSPAHFLRAALAGPARVIEVGLDDALAAHPDVIVLMDRVGLEADGALADWVDGGGLLIRFSGPRMAADPGLPDEPLLPLRLRAGGRDMGGALSWGEPRPIAPFPGGGPFAGLSIPDDVTIRAQLMAEPAPDLDERVIATLSDGTPLVSRAPMGDGQLVLFHSTANADWSSLSISGLFVSMLERLIASAGRAVADDPGPLDEGAGIWTAEQVLDGFGRLSPARDPAPLQAADLADGAAPGIAAGIYVSGERRLALNAGGPIRLADWPGAQVESAKASGLALSGWFLLAAAGLLLLDLAGSLMLRRGHLAALLLAALILPGQPPQAQELDPDLVRAASEFAMGYVLTGDAELDEISRAGLTGLSGMMAARTTVEPTEPVAIDLETADLSLMSFLYWPIGPDQPMLSVEAYLQLNRFLRGGGMILFDTRDADLAGTGAGLDGAADLRRIAGPLDLPPLAPVPPNHVLTRAFYLLDSFPGRYADGEVWVEAAAPGAGGVVNDGVSPVVIGGNAWAEAWAVDDRGLPLYAVGAGLDGERQREMANRFGVNLIMYVLTGNYKSDQIHVPDLLSRLQREGAP
ncbi:MAG: DUF4159 domain-containing protein [Paracoccus sp. (in: a-proteobacteria)]